MLIQTPTILYFHYIYSLLIKIITSIYSNTWLFTLTRFHLLNLFVNSWYFIIHYYKKKMYTILFAIYTHFLDYSFTLKCHAQTFMHSILTCFLIFNYLSHQYNFPYKLLPHCFQPYSFFEYHTLVINIYKCFAQNRICTNLSAYSSYFRFQRHMLYYDFPYSW
jgi:hypothetical protein